MRKIDSNNDGYISVVECVELLDAKADKYGLTKGELFKGRGQTYTR